MQKSIQFKKLNTNGHIYLKIQWKTIATSLNLLKSELKDGSQKFIKTILDGKYTPPKHHNFVTTYHV